MTTNTQSIPECITRDRLTSAYWPNLSFAGLIAVVTLGLVFLWTSFNRLNHTDLWGHLNFGRWIAEHGALPAVDPLAAAPSAIPALQSAWLAQTLGFEVQRVLGNEGLTLGHALLVTLTAGVLMLAVYRRGAPAMWAATAGLAMLILDLPIVGTIRPQLFGQLGVALFLLAIAELPRSGRALFWLPLVAALWANLHGSILMGIAVLGIHWLGCVSESFWRSRNWRQVLLDLGVCRATLALALVLAAGCINPHGPALYFRIAGFGGHPALAAISEWRALSLLSLTGVLFVLSLAALAVAWKYGKRAWRVEEVLLLVVFGAAMVPAIRMLAWWALVWPFVVWPHLASAWRARFVDSSSARHTECAYYLDEPTSMRTVMALGFVFMILLIAPPTFSFIAGRERGEGMIMVSEAPVYFADEILRRDLTGTIAAPLDWADFLVWKTNNGLQPLVHGHVHLSDAATWQAYESIFRGDENWLATLKERQVRYVVVPRRRYPNLARQVLAADRSGKGELRMIYQDQRCVLGEVRL